MIIHISDSTAKLNIKKIAIDTNILCWCFYGNIIYTYTYQKNIYPTFFEKLIKDKNCKIYTTMYNICELFNVIEKNEYELYLQQNNLEQNSFSKKKYRNINSERTKIKKTMQLIFNQIKSCINIEEQQINEEKLKEYINSYERHHYDIFDYTLVEYCANNDIPYILTDDIDFSNSKIDGKDINIITANKNITQEDIINESIENN